MRAETSDQAASVIMKFPPPARLEDSLLVIRRFLSALSWVEEYPVRETMSMGGSAPFGVGKSIPISTRASHFRADYLPYSEDPKKQLALALFRESMTVNSVAYRFLGFAKILNVLHKGSRQQQGWINTKLSLITDHRARERIAELSKLHSDVGAYLYESGRCAIAHAFAEPLVDPEDPEDLVRLHSDLPVIRALAAYLIEDELGIKSSMTIYREHQYELEGFKRLIGEDNVTRLKRGEQLALRLSEAWPRLSMRIRDEEPFEPLEGLRVKEILVLPAVGTIQVTCVSTDGLLRVAFDLDFREERLVVGPEMDADLKDDGTERAFRNASAYQRFRKAYYLNGELEIVNAESGERLGRCDPFIPLNIDIQGTSELIDGLIRNLDATANARAKATTGGTSGTEAD